MTEKFRRYGRAMVAMISLAWPFSAHAAPEKAMTSRAMVALSEKAADAKARQDLLSILQPTRKFQTGMFASVRGARMDTIPHGVGMTGMCAMDSMVLWYAATAVKADPMNTPKRPVGISVKHLYHAAGKAVAEDGRAGVANIWGSDCKRLQVDKMATWFEAQSDAEAAKAVNVLLAAADALRSGRLKAKNCDYGKGDKTCEDEILAASDVTKIVIVEHDCPPSGQILTVPAQECFSLDMSGGPAIVVRASFDEDSVDPKEILSISALTYVVVT